MRIGLLYLAVSELTTMGPPQPFDIVSFTAGAYLNDR